MLGEFVHQQENESISCTSEYKRDLLRILENHKASTNMTTTTHKPLGNIGMNHEKNAFMKKSISKVDLPVDIYLIIIEKLYFSWDCSTLLEFGLTCQQNYHFAIPVLWKKPRFHDKDHFEKFMTRLSLKETQPLEENQASSSSSSSSCLSNYTSSNPFILKLIKHLHLKHVDLLLHPSFQNRYSFQSFLLKTTNLVELHLCHSSMTGCIITDAFLSQVLPPLTHLKSLSLEGCTKVTDKSLQYINEKFNTLEYLNLSRIGSLTDKGFAWMFFSLKEWKYLKHLLASGGLFSNQVLKMLTRFCPNLITLRMDYCKNISMKGVKHVLELCDKLQILGISLPGSKAESRENTSITTNEPLSLSSVLNHAPSSLKSLMINETDFQKVNLSQCNIPFRELIIKGTCALELGLLSNLKKLEIVRHLQLNPDLVIRACSSLHSLEEVNFSFTPITSSAVNELIVHCPYLTKMNLSHNSTIDLREITAVSTQLLYFNCSFTKLTNDSCIYWIPTVFPNLIDLDISFCCRVQLDEPMMNILYYRLRKLARLNYEGCFQLLRDPTSIMFVSNHDHGTRINNRRVGSVHYWGIRNDDDIKSLPRCIPNKKKIIKC